MERSTNKVLRIAILGCGKIAGTGEGRHKDNHLDQVCNTFDNPKVYCFDTTVEKAEELASYCDGEVIPNIKLLKNIDPHLVVVATPPFQRLDLLKEVICHTSENCLYFIEKPISNVEVTDKLKKFFQKVDRRVIVNYSRRFIGSYQKIKNYLRGSLEKILIASYGDPINIGIHAFDFLDIILPGYSLNLIGKNLDDYFGLIVFENKSVPIYMQNFSKKNFEIFEIDLLFSNSRLRLEDFGKEIKIGFPVKNSAGEFEMKFLESFEVADNALEVAYSHINRFIKTGIVDESLNMVGLEESICRHNHIISQFKKHL